MHIYKNTCIKTLADKFLEDVLSKDNFSAGSGKSSFLTGGSFIVCESKGLQEYLQKLCVDKYKIWTALPFKPLAGLLMQCAYNLSPEKKDEKENPYNKDNLTWAVYRLLEGEEKTFFFASELASLFSAYQIYRPALIEKWNKGEAYSIKDSDDNFINNEKMQRELWLKLKNINKNEQDISQLYSFLIDRLETGKSNKLFLPRQIFIFAPQSLVPLQLSALQHLSRAGAKVRLYLFQTSKEYTGDSVSDKKIAALRKKAWENNKIIDEQFLYWDLGNRLTANLGRSSQILFEQILEIEDAIEDSFFEDNSEAGQPQTLLSKIQSYIANDRGEKESCIKDESLVFNSCFSVLREIEVLSDFILNLFIKNQNLTPADIAVVSPDIETYANAIETVFSRKGIPYRITDRNVKKSDKTFQLLNMLFSLADSDYEADDVFSLFEYSMYVQERELDASSYERLAKWVKENAIRRGLDKTDTMPNYSFESGFEQLSAGFFTISDNGFSDNEYNYCYPDIEGNTAFVFGDFFYFIRALKRFETESREKKTIDDWDYFFREILTAFFGTDETDFNEDKDNPYQKIISVWDSLKKEMLIGFVGNTNYSFEFSVLKTALLKKMEAKTKSSYSLSGKISFSNFETIRAVPFKLICCIGMNSGEFPRKSLNREISLMKEYLPGDKDNANEDRLMFLETICSAKDQLYISWIGQNEKTLDGLEPSSLVSILLKNLDEQYDININNNENLIVKHPLQPFSDRYFNGELKTFDNRWQIIDMDTIINRGKSLWEWEITNSDTEEIYSADDLYRILNSAAKYFLNTVCTIKLPEDINLLGNTEPFILENDLEKWKLADLILNNENYNEKILIARHRGELPSGNYADGIIENKIEFINLLKEKRKKALEKNPQTIVFIKPSKDKGKYRLWHWLNHIEINLSKENTVSELILLDNHIRLPGLSKENCEKYISPLQSLADRLKTKMQPVFPCAAWEYLFNKGKKTEFSREKRLSNAWEKIERYTLYDKMILENADSFKDLHIEERFIECSCLLFENYNGKEVDS